MIWKRIRQFIIFCLVIIILAQVIITMESYAIPWIERIWNQRDTPASERAARLSSWLKPNEAEFILFVRSSTPEDAIVVLPSDMAPFKWIDNMQYHLFPRTLILCESSEIKLCLKGVYKKPIYSVVVDNFPDPDIVHNHVNYIAFDESWGIILVDQEILK